MDRAAISPTAFDWLCQLSASFGAGGANIVEIENRRWLRMNNYVGVIRTPCGTQIEILPKNHDDADDVASSRALLIRLIAGALDLPTREVGLANIQNLRGPLSEWICRQFLQSLDVLVKRGLRFDYSRISSSERFLSGQFDIARQTRQPASRRHFFEVNYDIFSADRPENRLLKRALERVCKTTVDPDNWRLAHELRSLLHDVPSSRDTIRDFARWRTDRLMADYRVIKRWCELILKEISPTATFGNNEGISLLFPMERLFEIEVARGLRRGLATNATLTRAPSWHALCSHEGKRFFSMFPDMIVSLEGRHWIIDAKWKLIDQLSRSNRYELSQSDFYQLFAYGQKYLDGQSGGDMMLVYPRRSEKFVSPLPVFELTENLRLWVVPFDLDRGTLQGYEAAGLPIASP